ncbi:hypothetical protein FOZ62_024116, partial [Perkinsus olseni]
MNRWLIDARELRRHSKETTAYGSRLLNMQERQLGRSADTDSTISHLRELSVFPSLGREWPEILSIIEESIVPCVRFEKAGRRGGLWEVEASLPAVLSEAIVNGMAAVGLQWASCPVLTELEVAVMDTLAAALDLHDKFLHSSGMGGGLIQNTAADALLAVVAAARVRKRVQACLGMNNPMHGRVEEVPVGPDLSISVDELEAMIVEDKSRAKVPVLCVAAFGAENTEGHDNIAALGRICEREGIWFHVDASYGGGTLFLEGHQEDHMQINRYADSINMSGSCWLPTGLDMEFLWVKEKQWMTAAFAATGDYLPKAMDSISAPTLSKWSVPLGRQFRSLRLWCVLQYYGLQGLTERIEAKVATAGSRSAAPDERFQGDDQGFEANANLTIEFIARYFKSLEKGPVRDLELQAGSCAACLMENGILPAKGRSWEAILEDIQRLVTPGMCNWQHPRFLAFFPAKTSTPAILSEAIMAALGGISADPASHNAIEDRMEAIVMDALGKALGLGEEFLHTSGMGGGIIQNTASDALVAVVAAARTAMHSK